jgi:hypothetical protein
MSKMRGSIGSMAVIVAFGCAVAGTVEQATIFADPQMQVKSGTLQGCGYRLKAIPKLKSTNTSAVLLDASFNLYTDTIGFGLLKAGAVEVTIKEGQPSRPTNRPIESFWLKTPGASPTAPVDNKVSPAEDKGYLLYVERLDAVMHLFTAVWDDTPITIGMRIKGEPVDRIYTGKVDSSTADKEQTQQCFREMVQIIKKGLAAEEKK